MQAIDTPSAGQASGEPGQSAPPPPLSAVPARCLRCAADLSRLIPFGRYCPHCGLDTFSSPPAALRDIAAGEPARFSIHGRLGWVHLVELAGAVPRPESLPRASDLSPANASQVVNGYANALYGLGRRYETGPQPGRNPREATRCYLKSARLGNVMAFARLASRWLESNDAPEP